MTSNLLRRNSWTFAIGTLGRDMVYMLVSTYFIYYLTEFVKPSAHVLGWVSGLILAARLFDAVMDIVMGSIVDNTRTRWGQFKPWICGGVVASAIMTMLLFTNLSGGETVTVVLFSLFYLLWSLSWTTNDIPYWSLMPALTLSQTEREAIGSRAKIFATIGQFTVVGTIIPMVGSGSAEESPGVLVGSLGGQGGWSAYVLVIVLIMIAGQIVTLVGTKVPDLVVPQDKVTVREVFRAVFKNDQLMWVAIAMVTFMTGFLTTTTFGTYYFKYLYRQESMYTVFGIIMGISMIGGYLVFPLLRQRLTRRTLYTLATALIVAGYVLFYFAPHNIAIIGVAGALLFVGDAFITILMLGFISDTIDYGHWKFGKRNTAITFALQPFINKVGAALSFWIVAQTLIAAGIADENVSPENVSTAGQDLVKAVMMFLPLVMTLIGYGLYRWKYKIDETFHAQILTDLRQRGQLLDETSPTGA